MAEKEVLATVKVNGKRVKIYEATINNDRLLRGLLVEIKPTLASKPEIRELIGFGYSLHHKFERYIVTKRKKEELDNVIRLAEHIKNNNIGGEFDLSKLDEPYCINIDKQNYEYIKFVRPNGKVIKIAI